MFKFANVEKWTGFNCMLNCFARKKLNMTDGLLRKQCFFCILHQNCHDCNVQK